MYLRPVHLLLLVGKILLQYVEYGLHLQHLRQTDTFATSVDFELNATPVELKLSPSVLTQPHRCDANLNVQNKLPLLYIHSAACQQSEMTSV